MKIVKEMTGDNWHAYNGDSAEAFTKIPDNSIGLSAFSPPFKSLYCYSSFERDLSNCRTGEEFFTHFGFILREMFRITKPGRNMCIHAMPLPTSKMRDGVIGIVDFPGEIIQAASAIGWIYHSDGVKSQGDMRAEVLAQIADGRLSGKEAADAAYIALTESNWFGRDVTIWKDPVAAVTRTHALGLLHKQLLKDSARSRMGLPDRILTFHKPGDNPDPVRHTADEFPVSRWQKEASPIWLDIDAGDTLNFRAAREEKDEAHLCPLQLGVIERLIGLWSNPGDTVVSPFMGVGSEGFVALGMGRKFLGCELKPSYFSQAVKNLKSAGKQLTFDSDIASAESNA